MQRVTTGWLILVVALAAAACSGPSTTVNEGIGRMRFDRMLLLEDSAATSANASIGDLDADGHLDIVLVKGRHWPLVDLILKGDGAGGFEPARPVGETADRSYSGELVDIDADGDLDIVISNDDPDPKIVHMNDGTGAFTRGSTFGRPEWSTRHVSVADLNGDGQPDIVVANRTGDSSGSNYVCFNHGMGRFDEDCTPFSSESSTTVTPADIDGDDDLDLVVPHRDGGQSHIYLNDGNGGFEERIAFGPPDATIRKALAADLNGDGRLDLVTIDEQSGAALYMRQADGSFEAATPLEQPGVTPYALAIADLDRDGHMDIIVGHVQARPVAWFGDGRGGFAAVEFGDADGVAYGFAVGDLDEDGFNDIAMARSDAPNVLYFGSAATPPPE